ncbi:Borealin N terminal-domain-containing protein [Aspergillus granulosus]|uniref:Borealin N terminal-domain-containing protein n=1 Tax=Aspergillus granulosus TaxID=176169 RepID=A0ABR4GZC8_9EURO
MSTATKRKSSDMDDAYPVEDLTPTNTPPRKRMRITRSQKQALMDNLQLEITERARKLRAQYALQAQDLRARIERRVNRIPIALRKSNMGELFEKHNAALRAQLENSPRKYRSPVKESRNFTAISASGKKKAATASPSPRRVRKHSPGGIYSDKENAPASGEQLDMLKNPKRRAKPVAAGGTSRVVSQEVRGADYRILSPKSSNSRTYPQSPLRASPEKAQPSSYLSRPMSPLKPSSPLKSTSANRPGSSRGAAPARPQSALTTRPGSRAATGGPRSVRSPLSRPATRQGERRGSVSSSTSSGTTVANTSRSTTSRKATTASTASATAKKAAVARSQAPSAASKRTVTSGTRKATVSSTGGESTTGGRRTLRKRA